MARAQKLLADYFPGKKLKQEIDPNEVVAYGAAKHATTFYSSPSFQTDESLTLKTDTIDSWFSSLFSDLKSLDGLGGKLSEEQKEKISIAAKEAQEWLGKNIHREVHELFEKIDGKCQKKSMIFFLHVTRRGTSAN